MEPLLFDTGCTSTAPVIVELGDANDGRGRRRWRLAGLLLVHHKQPNHHGAAERHSRGARKLISGCLPPGMNCCTSSHCWATMRQKTEQMDRRWLSGLLLRQAKASLNLATGRQTESGYKTRASTGNILYGAPAGAWIRCHNLDRLLGPYCSRSPSFMWPPQDSQPHAASLNADESSSASPPASREGPVRALVCHGQAQVAGTVQECPWHLSLFALQVCGPGLSPSIAESHCLIDPSATLLGFAILASPRGLRKAKGKQKLSPASNSRVHLE